MLIIWFQSFVLQVNISCWCLCKCFFATFHSLKRCCRPSGTGFIFTLCYEGLMSDDKHWHHKFYWNKYLRKSWWNMKTLMLTFLHLPNGSVLHWTQHTSKKLTWWSSPDSQTHRSQSDLMDHGQIIWSPLCKLQDPKDQMPTSKHSMTPSTGPVSILDDSQLDRVRIC